MNKTIQGIIILIILFLVSFYHPLNANEKGYKVYYVAVPGVQVENNIIYGNLIWTDIEAVKDMIRLDVKGDKHLLNYQLKIYVRTGQAIPVKPYKINGVWQEIYLTFTIYKIIR